MNKLPLTKQVAVIRALTEGCSIRATARMVGVSKDTVSKLLVDFGQFASIYQDHRLRQLNTQRVEADEIWSFVGAKQRNATKPGQGDLWTWTALDADSKLMITWLVGPRNAESADAIMLDLRDRLTNRIQLTTDGFGVYYNAVANAWHWKTKGIDFAQLVKEYGRDPSFASQEAHRRYSPAVCTSTQKTVVFGDPDVSKISTSYAERANLSMLMGIRRFTRLTNAFSKKAENHAYSVSVFYLIYNFGRPHGTLTKNANGTKTTPAMAAGLTDHVWTVEEMLGLMDPRTARIGSLQSNYDTTRLPASLFGTALLP